MTFSLNWTEAGPRFPRSAEQFEVAQFLSFAPNHERARCLRSQSRSWVRTCQVKDSVTSCMGVACSWGPLQPHIGAMVDTLSRRGKLAKKMPRAMELLAADIS